VIDTTTWPPGATDAVGKLLVALGPVSTGGLVTVMLVSPPTAWEFVSWTGDRDAGIAADIIGVRVLVPQLA
jgi:hypothetical protein